MLPIFGQSAPPAPKENKGFSLVLSTLCCYMCKISSIETSLQFLGVKVVTSYAYLMTEENNNPKNIRKYLHQYKFSVTKATQER